MDSTVTDGRRQLLQDLLITGLALWYLTSWLLCGCDPEGRRVILSIVASLCLYAGEYLSAHYRVPCRIYPMVRLARLYIAQGMDAEALAQASHLPSVHLYGTVGSFDRSLRLLQNYETGEMVYTENYNMENSIGLSVRQNITATGGTLTFSIIALILYLPAFLISRK